jgi:hypothetical protein
MSFRSEIRRARQVAQEPKINQKDESWYGKYFVRHFSIYITYVFVKLKIPANLVTILMGLAGLSGTLCLISLNLFYNILGAVLWQFWFIFDCVDGEVARLRNQSSMLGIYLDDLTHIVVNPTFGLALGLHVCLEELTVFNIIVTFILCSACHWKRGIPRIISRTMVVKSGKGILERWTYRFDKKSAICWLRFIALLSFTEVGQIFIVPAVIILNHVVKHDITRWFLYLYTALFLGYLATLLLRDGSIVYQEDRSRTVE